MPRLRTVILTVFLLAAFALPARAQGAASPAKGGVGAQTQAQTIDTEALQELVETLESETARKEFVSNLKTLIAAREKTAPEKKNPPELIPETFGVDKSLDELSRAYESFLKRNNLTKGRFGRLMLSLLAVIVIGGLAYGFRRVAHTAKQGLNRIKRRYQLTHKRFDTYTAALRYIGDFLALFILLFTMSVIWDLAYLAPLKTEFIRGILGKALDIFLIFFFAALIWEIIFTAIENYIRNLDTGFDTRIQTLLPLIRNVVFIVMATLVGFVLLSELGVDIAPLLAGAGVVGIAVGFGAQNMVKDFLNGFFIILEDLVQIDDVVEIAGRRGRVEKITIRNIRMRNIDGTVYTIPFSEVGVIDNLTKEFSYYMMEIGVAYRENTDEVVEHLKAVDEDMRNDDNYAPDMMEPIDIMGVDAFADSAVVIRARLKTEPSKQWKVGREFNRRMKHRFDAAGIEIPFPHQTLYFGVDKDGTAPAANVNITEQAQTQ